MMRMAVSFICGAALSWLVTADHYGRIMTSSPGMGIACRIYGLDTVRAGYWSDQQSVCIDLQWATPEAVLWGEIKYKIRRNFNDPF